MTCTYRFIHPDRPRDFCGLASIGSDRCPLHSRDISGNFKERLLDEASESTHWLEGIRVNVDLAGIRLSGAKLPYAVFESRHLAGVALDGALLEGANFKGALLEGVSFHGAHLRRAAFDRARIQPFNAEPVDFRNADLSGVTLSGATIISPRLHGLRLSDATNVSRLLDTPCFEMEAAAWQEAAAAYAVIGKRAAEDWDIVAEQECLFRGMTCRHREAISAPPFQLHRDNWLRPTLAAGISGFTWLLHRVAWGYGYRPARLVLIMLAVILVFGLVVFPVFGVCNIGPESKCLPESPWLSGLVLSLNTFVTLTYGRHVPLTTAGEIAGGIEALIAAILLSLFLVSLAAKYVRRD